MSGASQTPPPPAQTTAPPAAEKPAEEKEVARRRAEVSWRFEMGRPACAALCIPALALSHAGNQNIPAEKEPAQGLSVGNSIR